MLPRALDTDTLLRSISWLRLKNAEGRNIYIRPAGEHSLSLIDDASIQVIEHLKSEGFAPAVVLETSPGNFQAWLHHGQILPKLLSTLAARLLASRFGGDLASADWRHYGRLAGFTLWPTAYRRTKPATPSPHVILRTKEIENAKKSILIGRSRRLGSESETIAKANDFLTKTQHSSCIAASALEGIEGYAKIFCAVRRNRPCPQTRASHLGGFRFLYECDF
jgi:hypothetical protein